MMHSKLSVGSHTEAEGNCTAYSNNQGRLKKIAGKPNPTVFLCVIWEGIA